MFFLQKNVFKDKETIFLFVFIILLVRECPKLFCYCNAGAYCLSEGTFFVSLNSGRTWRKQTKKMIDRLYVCMVSRFPTFPLRPGPFTSSIHRMVCDALFKCDSFFLSLSLSWWPSWFALQCKLTRFFYMQTVIMHRFVNGDFV